MTWLIKFSIEHRWLIVMLVLLGTIGGYSFIRGIPVDIYPDFNYPTVTILTEAHGMAPEEVEALVTFPLESALNGAPFVRRVTSASGIGLSFLRVEFAWGTDVRLARQTVAEKIQLVAPTLPDGVEAPFMGPIVSQLGEIVEFRLRDASGRLSPMELRDITDWIVRYRLQTIPGVAQVINLGGFVKQYQVLVHPEWLAQYHLNLFDVKKALAASNINAPGGFLFDKTQEYLIRGIGRIQSLDELERVVIATRADGFPILARDIADVRVGPEVRRGAASFNGTELESVVGKIIKQPGANTLEVTERILRTFEELKPSLPKGVTITPTYLQADLIRRAVDNVKEAVIEGGFFVALILAVFLLKARPTLISLVAIPTSLVATLLLLKWLGYTLNIMTLGGLAIAIGMVVDDGIIDVENTNRRLLEYFRSNNSDGFPTHERSEDVTLRATLEIRTSVIFATLIIAIAFVPLLTLSDIEGRMFGPLGKTVIIAMACSLLVSLVVTPALCQIFLTRPERGHERESVSITWIKRRYRPILGKVLDHGKSIAIATLAIVLASLIALPFMGREFLPAMDEGTFTLSANTMPGTSLDETRRMAHQIERALLEIPEVTAVGTRTGRAERDEHAHGVFANEILVHVLPPERRKASREELLEKMRGVLRRFPGMVISIGQPIAHRIDHILSGVEAQIAIKLFGPDLDILREKAQEIQQVASTVRGVADLKVEQQVAIPQIIIDIDRDAAARLGLSVGDLSEFIRMALNGEVVSQIIQGQRRYDLLLWLDEESRKDIEKIRELKVAIPTGGWIPLKAVADVRYTRGANTINRESVSRRIVVQCNVTDRDLGGTVNDLREQIGKQMKLPEGYFITYGGQFESQQRAMRQLTWELILIILGIFLVLFASFNSAKTALLMMLNLPLSLVGGVVSVLISGGTLSVSSMAGFILLFGIAVRNGIILISHVNDMRVKEQMPLYDAVLHGAGERISPILMTALTTALGVVPLALSGGSGAELQRPLAIVILGGMITSTALTLLVLPAVYYLVERSSEAEKSPWLWRSIAPLRLIFIPLIVSLAFSPLSVMAHGIHIGSELEDQQVSNAPAIPQTGPHGGLIGSIENYCFELLLRGREGAVSSVRNTQGYGVDTLLIYLYNREMKPLSADGKEGVLYLQLPDDVKVTLQLKPVADKKDSTAHFEGRIDLSDIESFKAVVSLKIDNKRHNLRFNWSKTTTRGGREK